MQRRQNKNRRLTVQNLEIRKLFAADVGFSAMSYGPEPPGEIASLRPGEVVRPTFGTIDNGCPSCDIEHQAEKNTTTEPTASTARTRREIEFTITIEPVNDMPLHFDRNTEQLNGSTHPKRDDI